MTSRPKVSVIMLAYNQERYISRAISSVMAQRTPWPIELIIADDHSTDQTRTIAEQWQKRFPERIKLLPDQPNMGFALNWLRAYRQAQGKYIAICEGDDFYISRKKLLRQVSFLDSHPDYAMCYHNVVNFYQQDHSKSLSGPLKARTMRFEELARWNPISNVSTCYRRSCIPPLPEWMARVKGCDLAMHMLCAQNGPIYYMPQPMAAYRKLATSVWTGIGLQKSRELSRQVRRLLMEHFEDSHPQVVREMALTCARSCISQMVTDPAEAPRMIQEIQSYGLGWTPEDIEREKLAIAATTASPGLKKRVLTACRRLLSKTIPLPRL